MAKSLLLCTGIGILLSLLFAFIAFFAAGAGHGSYTPCIIFFPYSMVATYLTDNKIAPILAVFALLQYPIYGALIGIGRTNQIRIVIGLSLLLIHLTTLVFITFFGKGL